MTKTIGTYTNEATAEGTYPGGTVTDTDDASIIVEDPSVVVDKTVVEPGLVDDRITFTITITNDGPSTLDEVPLFDTFSGPIEYIGGNVPADLVDNANGSLAWNNLTESLGDLQPGQTFEIETEFRLIQTITSPGEINNTARVTDVVDVVGIDVNEQDAAVMVLLTPSAIDLLRFTARPDKQGVQVKWETGMELNTWSFHLWRCSNGTRANAVRVTESPILAQGNSNRGATYTWLDTTAAAGTTYTYWLEEQELNDTRHEYGPAARLTTQWRVACPVW